MILIFSIAVCVEIKIRVIKENEEMLNITHQWELSSCKGSISYISNSTYDKLERCCLKPGQHILTCHNEKGPYGWGRSSIQIQGHHYCNDFVGFKAHRSVLIYGNEIPPLFRFCILIKKDCKHKGT